MDFFLLGQSDVILSLGESTFPSATELQARHLRSVPLPLSARLSWDEPERSTILPQVPQPRDRPAKRLLRSGWGPPPHSWGRFTGNVSRWFPQRDSSVLPAAGGEAGGAAEAGGELPAPAFASTAELSGPTLQLAALLEARHSGMPREQWAWYGRWITEDGFALLETPEESGWGSPMFAAMSAAMEGLEAEGLGGSGARRRRKRHRRRLAGDEWRDSSGAK